MESSGLGIESLTLLNYTDRESVWWLIIWQALFVCVCVCACIAAEPLWQRDVRSQQLDVSHLCGEVQNNPLLN